jgi:hypothetical protein
MIPIWLTVVTLSVISLFTSNPIPLFAGLILAVIAALIERFYK